MTDGIVSFHNNYNNNNDTMILWSDDQSNEMELLPSSPRRRIPGAAATQRRTGRPPPIPVRARPVVRLLADGEASPSDPTASPVGAVKSSTNAAPPQPTKQLRHATPDSGCGGVDGSGSERSSASLSPPTRPRPARSRPRRAEDAGAGIVRTATESDQKTPPISPRRRPPSPRLPTPWTPAAATKVTEQRNASSPSPNFGWRRPTDAGVNSSSSSSAHDAAILKRFPPRTAPLGIAERPRSLTLDPPATPSPTPPRLSLSRSSTSPSSQPARYSPQPAPSNARCQQMRAYAAWVNAHLRRQNRDGAWDENPASSGVGFVEDFGADLRDGVVLTKLLRILSREEFDGAEEDDDDDVRRVQRVVDFLEAETGRRVSVRAKDVVGGNVKSSMRLVHVIASFYKPKSVAGGSWRGRGGGNDGGGDGRRMSTSKLKDDGEIDGERRCGNVTRDGEGKRETERQRDSRTGNAERESGIKCASVRAPSRGDEAIVGCRNERFRTAKGTLERDFQRPMTPGSSKIIHATGSTPCRRPIAWKWPRDKLATSSSSSSSSTASSSTPWRPGVDTGIRSPRSTEARVRLFVGETGNKSATEAERRRIGAPEGAEDGEAEEGKRKNRGDGREEKTGVEKIDLDETGVRKTGVVDIVVSAPVLESIADGSETRDVGAPPDAATWAAFLDNHRILKEHLRETREALLSLQRILVDESRQSEAEEVAALRRKINEKNDDDDDDNDVGAEKKRKSWRKESLKGRLAAKSQESQTESETMAEEETERKRIVAKMEKQHRELMRMVEEKQEELTRERERVEELAREREEERERESEIKEEMKRGKERVEEKEEELRLEKDRVEESETLIRELRVEISRLISAKENLDPNAERRACAETNPDSRQKLNLENRHHSDTGRGVETRSSSRATNSKDILQVNSPRRSSETPVQGAEIRCSTTEAASSPRDAVTKVLYFTDATITPFMTTISKPVGEVTLKDFKGILPIECWAGEGPYEATTTTTKTHKTRFFFKSLDPEFGTVKLEINDEDCEDDDVLVPGWEGKIVAWVANGESKPEVGAVDSVGI